MSQAKGINNRSDNYEAKKSLVKQFALYMQNVIDVELDPFFERNLDVFEQDESDLNDGTGESLKQFQIFSEYESILEEKIEKFSEDQGYSSAIDCCNAIQEALNRDRDTNQMMLNDLEAAFAKMRINKDNRDDDAGSKDGSSSSSGSQADGKHSSRRVADGRFICIIYQRH